MRFLNTLFRFIKVLALLVLILAIAIPFKYGSTDPQYLTLRLLHSVLSLKHSLLTDEARPTLSAEYRALENMFWMKPITVLDLTADPIIAVKKLRSSFPMSTFIPTPSQCQVTKEIFRHNDHSVDTYWIDYSVRKFQRSVDKLLIYLHGGGYLLGDIHSHTGFECHLSHIFNITVLHVEYRLCPEHPLPAAVDDTIALYRALFRENISPSQIIFMGDSAGGGLALLTIQALLTHQLSLPRGVIAMSPWTDLSTSGESYTRNREIDVMLNLDHIKWIASQLLDTNESQLSLNNPLLSPLFGSFKGFPPLYITFGTAELLEDDSREVVKKAKEAGVDVTFEEGLHLMHVYPSLFVYSPEAQNSLDNMNKWIQTIFAEKHKQ